jgi:hypothetical protein
VPRLVVSTVPDTAPEAEQELTLAFYNCHIDAHDNQEYDVFLFRTPKS